MKKCKALTKIKIARKQNLIMKGDLEKLAKNTAWKKALMDYCFQKINHKKPTFKKGKIYKPLKKDTIIILSSDLQIGTKINNWKNYYSSSVLKERNDMFMSIVAYFAKQLKIKNFHITDLGDAIDHNALRPNHKNSLEHKKLTTQIVNNVNQKKEMISFFKKLGRVTYGGVSSNHCRSNGIKGISEREDDFGLMSLELLNGIKGYEGLVKYDILDKENGIYNFKINGKNIVLTHSDLIPKETVKMTNFNHIKLNVFDKVDYVLTGHYHNTLIRDRQYQVGSIMGTDSYATRLGFNSVSAQGILIVKKTGEIFPIPINL